VEQCDVVVVGAGIAGASVASELAIDHRVLLLEREDAAGYHTTGRSAALFTPTYGPPQIRALTRASADFFAQPDSGFCSTPLIRQRDVMMVAREDQLGTLEHTLAALQRETPVDRLAGYDAEAAQPLLRAGHVAAALMNRDSYDIDVDALHGAWLRQFRARGGRTLLGADVVALERRGDTWRVTTSDTEITAPRVVNAAGAWADELACLAGARPVGLVPKRRTVAVVAVPEGYAGLHDTPMVIDVDEQFFLKPEAGRLLVSPADATPSEPCDARPEEYDIALGIDRVQRAFALEVRRVESAWAGLRSFVEDGLPVVGEDPDLAGFFWLCGQGGYGIQTAPAMSWLAAALLRGEAVPESLLAHGVDALQLSPARRVARD